MEDLADDGPKKTPRATIVRRALVALLALACAAGWIYTRYLVKKEALGGACTYDLHCRSEAPRCLKQSAEGEGVCSHACSDDSECAPEIKCVKVELEDRDERGRPIEGGYCFPQALLEARRKKHAARDAGPPPDSWVDVPESAGQLEGELVVERAAVRSTYEVKGTLLLSHGSKHARTIVDTSTLRIYTVDDDKKTFSASQIATGPGDVRVTKTDKKERVAERECEVWTIDEGKTKREACVVKGSAFVDPTARSVAPWEKELAVRGVFPLRISEGDKAKLEVVKVDAHPLAASRFAIPKSYKNLAAR